jgi:EAL domain-containing protein (putative c-di-GMP-specific phosphodiesterase class I)
MCSVEGLARWRDEDGNSISPAEFIPIAENVGLIDQLGGWALEQACIQLTAWAQDHDDVPTLSINVSTLQLGSTGFVSSIGDLLERYPAASGRLCLELTESVLVAQDSDWHRDVLATLSAMGIGLAIDDFGTGYSSLHYLHELVVDQIKIDRAFVVSAAQDERQAQLLHGIVGLGKGLGLSVVVEGVETTAELALAHDLGCDLVQGYLLGKPMAADEIAQSFGVQHPYFASSDRLAA